MNQIKRILDLKLKNIMLKRENQKLMVTLNHANNYAQHLRGEIIVRDKDLESLEIILQRALRQKDAFENYHKGLNHIITCPMCHNKAVCHKIFGAKAICTICKEEEIELCSTTCGHIICGNCVNPIINNYNLLE